MITSMFFIACKPDVNSISKELENNLATDLIKTKTIEDSILVYQNLIDLIDNKNYSEDFTYKNVVSEELQSRLRTNLEILNRKKLNEEEMSFWSIVEKAKSKEMYLKYLSKYPNGKFTSISTEQINKIEEEQFWNNTIIEDSLEGYKKYLEKYPNGIYKTDARNKIVTFTENEEVVIKKPKQPEITDKVPKKSKPELSFKATNMQLLQLICNQQNEIIGKDRINLSINNRLILNEKIMRTGDIIDLTHTESIPVKDNKIITIIINEIDKMLNDIILEFSLDGNNYKPDNYKKIGRGQIRGKYTLIYELK